MGNSYFQFKKFRVDQEGVAMKVCTDSCLLGAITDPSDAKSILDIGTGTGLLALMLAQKSDAKIDAVEIEENAYHQAEKNFSQSPWKERLHIFHTSIQDFAKKSNQKYDLIISNPPFFSGQLKSPDKKINTAHHDDSLSLKELAKAIQHLLRPEGKFYALLPVKEFSSLSIALKNLNIFPEQQVTIKDNPNNKIFRIVGGFSFYEKDIIESELIIKSSDGKYTEDFVELMREYYLYL